MATNKLPASRVKLILAARDLVDAGIITGRESVEVNTLDLLALITPDLDRLRDAMREGDTVEFLYEEEAKPKARLERPS